MKTRVYLRIARTNKGSKVVASMRPNFEALEPGGYGASYATVQIALDLDIPDKEFDKARILLEAKIKSSEPSDEIKQVQ